VVPAVLESGTEDCAAGGLLVCAGALVSGMKRKAAAIDSGKTNAKCDLLAILIARPSLMFSYSAKRLNSINFSAAGVKAYYYGTQVVCHGYPAEGTGPIVKFNQKVLNCCGSVLAT
jgi:hypothetical protein